MLDYDQDSNEVCKDLLKTKDGINCLAQYSSSVGRYFHILILSCITFAILFNFLFEILILFNSGFLMLLGLCFILFMVKENYHKPFVAVLLSKVAFM